MPNVSSKSMMAPTPSVLEVSDAWVVVFAKKTPAPKYHLAESAGWSGMSPSAAPCRRGGDERDAEQCVYGVSHRYAR